MSLLEKQFQHKRGFITKESLNTGHMEKQEMEMKRKWKLETETGNGNWKRKWEQKTHQSLCNVSFIVCLVMCLDITLAFYLAMVI